jgi:hypothetical protein
MKVNVSMPHRNTASVFFLDNGPQGKPEQFTLQKRRPAFAPQGQ